jgi:hypothetical protein
MKTHKKTDDKKSLLASIRNVCSRPSEQTKKQVLAIIGIVMVSICILTVVDSTHKPVGSVEFIPDKYTTPFMPHSDSDEAAISTADYKMLLQFVRTMDSLKVYDRASYDTILLGHDGLLDSVHFVLSLYQESLHQMPQ